MAQDGQAKRTSDAGGGPDGSAPLSFRSRGWLVVIIVILPLALALWATRRYSSGLQPVDTVGKPVPAFALSFAGGGSFSSDKLLQSKVWSLVVFWTVSCPECRDEAPEIRRLVENPPKGGEPFQVVSINIGDNERDVAAWMTDFKMPFAALLDSEQKVAHAFGVTGVPEMYFVDPEGVVRHRAVGGISSEEMARILEILGGERKERLARIRTSSP